MANQQHTLVMVQPNHPAFIHTLPLPPIPPVVVPMQNYPPFWWNYAYRILQYAISLFFRNFCNAEKKWIKRIKKKEYNWERLLCTIFYCLNWCLLYILIVQQHLYCPYFSFVLSLSLSLRLFLVVSSCAIICSSVKRNAKKKMQSWVWWQCSSKMYFL